jgi:hypothetical protein
MLPVSFIEETAVLVAMTEMTIIAAASTCAIAKAHPASSSWASRYPLPNLLDSLAMPGCSKIKSQWDRCGVHYVNPIEQRER